jgi:hypothetical protein
MGGKAGENTPSQNLGLAGLEVIFIVKKAHMPIAHWLRDLV